MKKFYVLLVCTYATMLSQAQTWIGGASGNWNSGTNWSGGTVPNSTGAAVVFNSSTTVLVDIATINLASLQVTNGATVKLYTNSNVSITLNGTTGDALKVDPASTLIDSSNVNNTLFNVIFANNTTGNVSGTWVLTGILLSPPGGRATFTLPSGTGLSNVVSVYGTMQFAGGAVTPLGTGADSYLVFNSGSTFIISNGASTPRATWDDHSTIRLEGQGALLRSGTTRVGNVVVNIPATTATTLDLPSGLVISGNLDIQGTNDQKLNLAQSGVSVTTITVNGNLNISGSSKVVLATDQNDNSYLLDVKGAFNMSGTSFTLRENPVTSSLNNPTVLRIAQDFNQTAGTFTNASIATSTNTELYVVELDGTTNQNISSASGSIDDANNQVTLRINNPGGVTLLQPLSVGKLSWNSANKGVINATSALLTINNTHDNATDPTVVNAPASNGYVFGAVRRKVASAGNFIFPTGSVTAYRPITISPTVATASTFDAQYFASGYSDQSVQAPLLGVSNSEYWTVSASPAINATLTLTLNGTAVSGTNGSESLVVAAYGGAGTGWVNAAGSQLTPANSTSGSVISAPRNSFGAFTFGYGVIGTLPVNLVSFDAKKTSSNAAVVSWSVAPNGTASYFEVLKSVDGSHFTKAGVVSALKFTYDYRFNDNNLASGTTYYRLNMVDQSGASTRSKIVAVVNSVKGVVMSSMMPTVVTNSARINVSSSQNVNLQLVVTDMNGRVIHRQQAGITAGANQEVRMNLQSLAAGAYQVSGYAGGELVGTIRFIKQ